MEADGRREVIEVWRPDDLPQLELRRGFGVGRPVPRHWHEEYQLCLVESGPSELVYRGDSLPTPPASLFMVHPGEVHSNRVFDDRQGCSYRTLFIEPELMRRAAAQVCGREAGLPFFPTAVVFDAGVIRQYLGLHSALELPSSSLERETRLLGFLAALITRFAESRPPERAPGAEERAVKLARDYLAEHFADNVTLEDLARVARLSPFHFSRVFAERTGMPPHAFQIQLRVTRARALLREGRRIAEVAAETGFADQSHLTRHFKRLAVVTPGQYARRSKNVQDGAAPPR